SLLNPENERIMLSDTTDKDIYKAVMDSPDAVENGEINGGDDDVDDDASITTLCPTRCKALQAATTLQKFIEDMDEPYAQKLEAILASFGRTTCLEETCAMKDTSITDFFN
ncbi:hypothetical protein BDP27DRAFT_1185037, partial [Rhodocollybia butyracea]